MKIKVFIIFMLLATVGSVFALDATKPTNQSLIGTWPALLRETRQAVNDGAIPVATTSQAGKVKPDGVTILVEPDGTISSTGGVGSIGPQGPIGPAGPTGPAGPQGVQGIAGPGFDLKGDWLVGFSYEANDYVQYQGSSYVAVDSSTGVIPGTNALKWMLSAQKGTTGATGATGAQGIQGLIGPAGSVGATGATGATGVAGPKGDKGDQGTAGIGFDSAKLTTFTNMSTSVAAAPATYATAAQGTKADTASTRVFDLSDYASLQTAVDAVSAAGGGTVLNTRGAMINISSTFVPKNKVKVDLNGGVLKWTGAASGVMVENDITTYGVKSTGMFNGHLDPGGNVVTLFKFHSVRNSYYGRLNLISGGSNLVFMHLLADAQVNDPSDSTRNTNDNEFGPFSSDGNTFVPVIKQALILEGFNDGGNWRGVTVNQFTGPWKFFTYEKGYSFKQYCDSNKFTGRHTITLAHATVPGTCVVFNDSATPDQPIDVWGEHIDHLSCETWYPALAGQKAVEINHAGGITIDYLGNDRVSQGTWPVDMITDNYSQGHAITYVEGAPNYKVKQYIKGEMAINGSGNGITFPDATKQTTAAVVGPATNSADYVPQWDGANSKTLKNGYAVSSSGGASKVLLTDSNGSTVLKSSDATVSFTLQNDTSTANRFPAINVRNFLNGTAGFPGVNFYNNGGTASTPTATGSGTTLGGMYAHGYGDNAEKLGGKAYFLTTGSFTNANQRTSFALDVGTDGSNGAPTNRMLIGHDGVMTFTGTPTFSGTGVFSSTLRATRLGAGLATTPSYALDIYDSTVLGSALNNTVLLSQISGNTNTSSLRNRQWIVRDTDASTGWDKTTWHDALSVDSSFATPRTDTRTWFERDPSGETFAWGSQATTSMTLTKAGNLTVPGAVTSGSIPSPGAIGGTTPAAITGTTITATGNLTISGTINNPASAVDTDATIDTAATPVAIFTSSTTTTLTASNVVAGRCFSAIITSTSGGAISFAGFTPRWMDGSAPGSITATKTTAITCMGTGANTADCIDKENY